MLSENLSAPRPPSTLTTRSTEAPRRDASELFMYASPFVALSAASIGVAGLLDRGPSFLRQRPILSALLACGGMAALVKTQFDRFFLERPEYELERAVDGLEIRRYAPRVVAETTVDAATFDEAREIGFKRLAEYIFGANISGEHLLLGAPASSAGTATSAEKTSAAKATPSEHLRMMSPVTVAGEQKGYVMHFQMPKRRTIASLPRPKDVRVVLRRLSGERVAVLKFRGTYAGATVSKKTTQLLKRVKAAGLTPKGTPVFAGYDSPATLPLIRRVEVWVQVSENGSHPE